MSNGLRSTESGPPPDPHNLDESLDEVVNDDVEDCSENIIPERSLDLASCTDHGNAVEFALVWRHELRSVDGTSRWLVFRDGHWQNATDGDLILRARRLVMTLRERLNDPWRDGKDRELWAKHVRSSLSHARLRAMTATAVGDPRINVDSHKLDSDTGLLNVVDHTIELGDGSVRAPRARDLLTRCAPVRYERGSRCPNWMAFLRQVLPRPEVRKFVQRAVGYTLGGTSSEQVLFICYGHGANGKTTFLNLLLELFGTGDSGYAYKAPANLLMRSKGERHPVELVNLRGRRLVVVSETPVDQAFDEQLVKELTGNENITARGLYEPFRTFRPSHSIWLAANHLPRVNDPSHGFWRRILPIPFEVVIDADRQDRHLHAKLMKELPGILNWALEGHEKYVEGVAGTAANGGRDGLRIPKVVQEARVTYRANEDALGAFLDECCTFDPDARVDLDTLADAMAVFFRRQQVPVPERRALTNRLKESGVQSTRLRFGGRKATVYKGIGLIGRNLQL